MSFRWQFTDLTDSSSVIFSINPNEGGSPALSRTITTTPTLVPGGKTIVWQGADLPDIITFSGVILDETQLDLYATWFAKYHQVQLLDDLGRTSMIMITDYKPQRVRFGHNFWRHTFTVTATVIDWS